MKLAATLLFALALAGCAASPPPSTPEAACRSRAEDDPAVREVLQKASEPYWLWQNEGKVEIVRQQAIARCLQGRGYGVRGGVERPR